MEETCREPVSFSTGKINRSGTASQAAPSPQAVPCAQLVKKTQGKMPGVKVTAALSSTKRKEILNLLVCHKKCWIHGCDTAPFWIFSSTKQLTNWPLRPSELLVQFVNGPSMTEGAAPVLMSQPPPVPWAVGWLSQSLGVVQSHIRGMMTFSCLPGNRSTHIWHSGGRWNYGCSCSVSLYLPWAAMAAWAVFHF